MSAAEAAPEALFADHLAERQRKAEAALAATGFDGLVLHAGTPMGYFADDSEAPHHSTPHFGHWTPLEGPHHLLQVRPGERPKLVRVAPEDYWYEQAPLGDPFWAPEFDVLEVGTPEQAFQAIESSGRAAFVGDAEGEAASHGFDAERINPAELVARLDWDRSYKTPHEVACIEEANRVAARAHLAAREAFEGGGSELEIHHAYTAAAGCTDRDLPYESIVAVDGKGAILHYLGKRSEPAEHVLLIDAGARHLGYASDITRTWARPSCDSLFQELIAGVDLLERQLCEGVKPGVPYLDLHLRAHVLIGDLLHSIGIIRRSGEEALAEGITTPFFPHGLGHYLGIQTHDVSGHQEEPAGGTAPPPADHPFLRTTRTLEADQVLTIEPGLYFIEMLLRPFREGPKAELFDWALIDRLAPLGGVRVEDDVVVTAAGQRNLTRPYV